MFVPVMVFPTTMPPATPTPPVTISAPVVVDVEVAVDVIVTAPLVSAINNLDILLVCNDMPFRPPSLKILVPVVPPK